jgi:Flp pilus assembly CpaF family ATPase
MLIDLIRTSFCEAAIDEERSYVSGRMDDGEDFHLKVNIVALSRLTCTLLPCPVFEERYSISALPQS